MLQRLLNAVVLGVAVGASGFFCCFTVIEVLDLRARVDKIERSLEEGFEIVIPLPDIQFGEPTLAPPREPVVAPRAKNRSC